MIRRIVTADKVSVGFEYQDAECKRLGLVRYNLCDGKFFFMDFPQDFDGLRIIGEYLRLLRFASKIVSNEVVK